MMRAHWWDQLTADQQHAQHARAVADSRIAIAFDDYARAAKDATLGVGHVWTMVACPAYRTYRPADCTCHAAPRPRSI